MTEELDRLLTITDLSEMLSVPVDILYRSRHRDEGPRGYRIGRHGLTPKPTDAKANVAHIERRPRLAGPDSGLLRHPRRRNGGTEAINLIIEKVHRRAHGYKDFDHYRLRISSPQTRTVYRIRQNHA